MNRLGILSAAAAIFCVCLPMRAAGRAECGTLHSRILGHPVGYCAVLPPGYSPRGHKYPVLYFFHGLGGNQFMFVQDGALDLIDDLWEQHRIGNLLIVTPQADNSFYINARNGKVRYQDFLLHEFFPFIERHYAVRPGRRFRAVGGISMGGYGALHLAFEHPEMFNSVSVESPALIARLPEIRLGKSGGGLSAFFGNAFGTPPSPSFWAKNSPLTLARSFNPKGLKIYFDCGKQDDYGFNQGAEELNKILNSRGIPHQFHLYPGGHNWIYFARHLPQALEFSSRAFGFKPGAAAGQQ